MPILARLDAPGVLHHIIIWGIERRNIFRDNKDRDNFIDRLSDFGKKVSESRKGYLSYVKKGEKIYSKGRRKVQVEARDLLCYWAVRELGISCTDLAKQLGMTQPGVGYAVSRGEKIAKENNYQLL